MLSILIPSCNDPALQKTIDDIRKKFVGEYEIIVIFDGYVQDITGADVILTNKHRKGLRASVNRGASVARGEYLMKTDEHCMFDDGFDKKILEHIEDTWVVVPRRYSLNPHTWTIYDEPPFDYDRLVIDNPLKIGGARWKTRDRKRKDILLDENMVFQGSCWVMSKKHWDWLGGLDEKGYGSFAQEPVEIALKTWLGGGAVMVNKKTWYAHKHRRFGRIVAPSGREIKRGNAYSRDFWLNNRWKRRVHDLDWLMKKFV